MLSREMREELWFIICDFMVVLFISTVIYWYPALWLWKKLRKSELRDEEVIDWFENVLRKIARRLGVEE